MHLPEQDKMKLKLPRGSITVFREGIGQFIITILFVNFCLKSLMKSVNSFKNKFLEFRTAFSLYFYQEM